RDARALYRGGNVEAVFGPSQVDIDRVADAPCGFGLGTDEEEAIVREAHAPFSDAIAADLDGLVDAELDAHIVNAVLRRVRLCPHRLQEGARGVGLLEESHDLTEGRVQFLFPCGAAVGIDQLLPIAIDELACAVDEAARRLRL